MNEEINTSSKSERSNRFSIGGVLILAALYVIIFAGIASAMSGSPVSFLTSLFYVGIGCFLGWFGFGLLHDNWPTV